MQVFLIEFGPDSQARMNPDETLHCMKVLRHQVGDTLMAIDGTGTAYQVQIREVVNKMAHLDILESFPGWGESGKEIHLFASPLRLRDRFEWMVEKSVELGVTHFHPIECAHTEPYKSKYKEPRIRTLMLTATKQTKRSHIPALSARTSFAEALSQPKASLRILAYCQATKPIQDLNTELSQQHAVEIWMGPEGDFSEQEVTQAQEAGFEIVSLGAQRLRTETASLFGLSWLKSNWGY